LIIQGWLFSNTWKSGFNIQKISGVRKRVKFMTGKQFGANWLGEAERLSKYDFPDPNMANQLD